MTRVINRTLVNARLLAGLALFSAVSLAGAGTAVAQDESSAAELNIMHARPALGNAGVDVSREVAVEAPGVLPASSLTAITESGVIHAFPTVDHAKNAVRAAADYGPLVYHSGGAVMGPSVTIYPIFWVPAKLQNGASTSMSTHYEAVEYNMLKDYAGHGIGDITTQYYQKIGTTVTYVQNKGGLDSKGTYFVDTSAYPASGCKDSATPGNCLTDAQIRAEVQKVLTAANLTGGLDKIFMVFTSSGEGSCFDSTNKSCAYTQYCAYHSYFKVGTTPVVYANEPYGNTNACQVSGAPSPNGDPAADATATSASHELTEAITDPLLNAWYTSQGNEIGDLCAYDYGYQEWDNGNAEEMWNGRYYLLQTEFDNHAQGCYAVGP